MPASPGKQKRLQKQKKKRAAARKRDQTRRAELQLATSEQGLLRRAVSLPPGPCYVSPEWRDADSAVPRLVSVVITRRTAGGQVILASALVDRTCLGAKNGFVAGPMSEATFESWLGRLAQQHGGMEPCDLLVAQSIVFHALDYARSLGFEPHPDFPAPLFGPRPAELLDTPLARPARPFYVSGPHDNTSRILQQLRSKVGDDFDVMAGMEAGAWLDDEPDELEEGDELEGDDELEEGESEADNK